MGLEPGYAAGIISGSYTVTAVMGVAQSAISSGAFTPPEGMSIDHVSANIAAGYAISYSYRPYSLSYLSSTFLPFLVSTL